MEQCSSLHNQELNAFATQALFLGTRSQCKSDDRTITEHRLMHYDAFTRKCGQRNNHTQE
eukprot:2737489-Amphidinium_carterae.1